MHPKLVLRCVCSDRIASVTLVVLANFRDHGSATSMDHHSHIIAGGGLHGCLVALALLDHDRNARIALLERGTTLGGNHLWSFHCADVSARAMRFVAPARHV